MGRCPQALLGILSPDLVLYMDRRKPLRCAICRLGGFQFFTFRFSLFSIHFAALMFFILCPIFIFTGRGARMRGEEP